MIADLSPGLTHTSPTSFAPLQSDDTLMAAARPDIGYELWRIDVAATQVTLLRDINPGPANGFPLANAIEFRGAVYISSHNCQRRRRHAIFVAAPAFAMARVDFPRPRETSPMRITLESCAELEGTCGHGGATTRIDVVARPRRYQQESRTDLRFTDHDVFPPWITTETTCDAVGKYR